MVTPNAQNLCRACKRGWMLLLTGLLVGCASSAPAPKQKSAAFWPPYPDEPRIQYLTSFKASTDVEPAKSQLDELVMGKEPQETMGLQKPYGIEMYQGKIYVCDLRNGAVTVLDLRNHRTLVLGRSGSDTLLRPTDIAISDDGLKYVADQDRGLVYVFDAQERLFGKIGHKDLKPVGVAVWQDELYVCDFQGKRIEVFNRKSGKFLRFVGESGPGDGQFLFPLGIAVDVQGNLYVTDVLKCTMQKFGHDGKLSSTFGVISANAGGFVRPKHIAVDRTGTIFVVDAAFQNVQLFNQIGRVYTYFGSSGSHPGNMNLPVGICVHEGDIDLFQSYIHPAFEAERLILVTNQFGDSKVAVYAMGHLRAGKTVADIAAAKDVVPMGISDPSKSPTGLPTPTTLSDDLTAPGPTTLPVNPDRK
ncbi:MAG TPA: 6-bladed beta-propeller [Tepidisphaeraceae bacterium]|nr:6-bladed beta-propeller [Tepidisphaeraceae bacterium]